MEPVEQLLQDLAIDTKMTLEEIPNIDLYMDQVIQLFEKKFAKTKRNEEDKILTKTMINNYAKGHLLFPIKNKKYSKEHLILLNIIYQLKGVLSINDIKNLLDGLNKKIMGEGFDPSTIYECYLQLLDNYALHFSQEVNMIYEMADDEVKKLGEGDHTYFNQLLIIASLAHMSTLYKRAAEKLLDGLGGQEL